ncbi:MAG: hypothetical protein CMP47_00375 [Rickettsiales bacterium]|jgi:hypothetical protein|nr:hypothetical protein [Rickettsiales bacterium]
MEKRFKLAPTQLPKNSKYALITKSFGAFDTLIYFVNCSEEVLRKVDSSTSGFITLDDTVAPLEGGEDNYRNVLPGEAVLVDKYNVVYDSDGLKQLSIEVYENERQPFELRYIFKKRPQDMSLIDDNDVINKKIKKFLIDEPHKE